MFDAIDFKYLDSRYFNIITVNEYDVTIMSWNTDHYWYLQNPEYSERGMVIIFYKYKASHPYHQRTGRTPCGRRYGASGGMIGGR